jgi:predicted signal transduction protein with EAL and GGDEF domain
MPEVDWLTGLASREAFARAVNQADRDRDPLVVATIAIEDFADLNRLCGYEAGDDLLRTLGRALAERASVDITAGRLGGNRFGLLWAPAGDEAPEIWLAPILGDVGAAAGRWASQQLDVGGSSPVTPDVVAGVAAGFSARTWVEAELALELACDRAGPAIVTFDADDYRVVRYRWRQRVIDDLAVALRRDGLSVVAGAIEPLAGGPGRWLRLGVPLPGTSRADDRVGGPVPLVGIEGGATPHDLVLGAIGAAPALALALDRRLTDRAEEIVSCGRGQLRVTVPLVGPLTGRRSPVAKLAAALERGAAPPTRILFEIDQGRLAGGDALAGVRELSAMLTELGSGVVVAGYVGGWEAWRAIDGLPVAYLKPHHDLVTAAAEPGSSAARILETVVDNAGRTDRQLVAPVGALPDQRLIDLGFHHVERPARTLDDLAS